MEAAAPESSTRLPPKPNRRWFQFSLRMLLLMMLVFGCGLGWVVSERKQNVRGQAVIDAICDLGGYVRFGSRKLRRPAWIRLLLGDDSYRIRADVDFRATEITDAGLEHLKRLRQLRVLNLEGTKITDAGLVHLKGLTQLHSLILVGTKITDAGLEHLKGLTRLSMLDLAGTNITDAGLADLQKALPNCGIRFRNR